MRYLILLLLAIMTTTKLYAADQPPIAIAIHGGAGTIERESMDADKEKAIRAALGSAARAGYEVLQQGGSSVSAVSAAITQLEDSPHFNAARGAVLNQQGEVEMDASIMDGDQRRAGAIAAVRGLRNPILLARAVMEHSPHVLLMGEGAAAFARQRELAFEPPEYFETQYRRRQLEAIQNDSASAEGYRESWFSTVGTIALDQTGRLAAGTSTGGTANKRWGRVGDSPIIGAGTYADSRYCAISATGHGEYFIRAAVAHDICARVAYQDVSLREAARKVVNEELVDFGGSGGVIALDPRGEITQPFNTPGMYRASIDTEGNLEVAIYGDE